MRRECLESVGAIDENLLELQEYDLVLRLGKEHEGVYLSGISEHQPEFPISKTCNRFMVMYNRLNRFLQRHNVRKTVDCIFRMYKLYLEYITAFSQGCYREVFKAL